MGGEGHACVCGGGSECGGVRVAEDHYNYHRRRAEHTTWRCLPVITRYQLLYAARCTSSPRGSRARTTPTSSRTWPHLTMHLISAKVSVALFAAVARGSHPRYCHSAGCMANVEVRTPIYDYVPPSLISLYITNGYVCWSATRIVGWSHTQPASPQRRTCAHVPLPPSLRILSPRRFRAVV